jgi:spermidine/putrescine transport system substrate-binding protein
VAALPDDFLRPHRSLPINRPMDRRLFLSRMALATLGGSTALELLAGCTKAPAGSTSGPKTGGSSASPTFQVATPDHPVTWPVHKADLIADGLAPEKNATLRVYNYADYLGPDIVKRFEKKFKCKVIVSTFNDGDEALTKVRTGTAKFDLFFTEYGFINKLVTGGLIRPLNQSYVPNIKNLWPQFSNPWYDQQWHYTVPYTVFTTGMGWRADMVDEDINARPDPYDVFWDPKYKKKLAVLDDRVSCMGMVLLHAGLTDVNTTKPKDLAIIREQLLDMQKKTSPKVTITEYTDLPGGQYGVGQMWSGDIINAQYYLAKGAKVKDLRFFYAAHDKGQVDNDILVIPKQGQNPVLAHEFINFLIDTKNAVDNFGYIGYQPPQQSLDANNLVSDGYVPKNLAQAVVKPDWFDTGYRTVELSPDGTAAWQRIWQEFKAGA